MEIEWPAANCLRVDHAAVEAIGALRDRGVRPLLLKGPVIAHWLYADNPAQRPYNDADVLVAHDQLQLSAEVLGGLGYRCELPFGHRLPHGRPRHAECWFRERDNAAIDLHQAIHGTERCTPGRVWEAANRGAETIDVLGTLVDTPGEAFRLVHLVLHIGPDDDAESRARVDLDRALRVVAADGWTAAAELAEELGVTREMGALLRRSPAGDVMADDIGLPTGWPLHLRLRFEADSYAGRFLAEVLESPPSSRIRLIVEKIVPPADYLRSTRTTSLDRPHRLALAHFGRLSGWRRRGRGLAEALHVVRRSRSD